MYDIYKYCTVCYPSLFCINLPSLGCHLPRSHLDNTKNRCSNQSDIKLHPLCFFMPVKTSVLKWCWLQQLRPYWGSACRSGRGGAFEAPKKIYSSFFPPSLSTSLSSVPLVAGFLPSSAESLFIFDRCLSEWPKPANMHLKKQDTERLLSPVFIAIANLNLDFE